MPGNSLLPSQVFLQLRKQAFDLVLLATSPDESGEGFSSYSGHHSPIPQGRASFPRLALVNFLVVAARDLCSDLVPLGSNKDGDRFLGVGNDIHPLHMTVSQPHPCSS